MTNKYAERKNNQIFVYAQKYYGTRDLSRLTPHQLDKITTWVTNHKPTKGQNKDRQAGRSKGRFIKGNI